MKERKQGLCGNCLFLLKFAYKENKALFLTKLSQIILKAVYPFLPIVFVRMILNELTISKDIKRLIYDVVFLSVSVCVTGLLLNVLDYFSQNQVEITVRKIRNRLGRSVMEMSYSNAEQPKIRDFILLAQDGTNFTRILDRLSNMITAFFTLIGLFAIIVTAQPAIFLFVALTVLFRLIADKKGRELWDKWRPKYAPIMRKVNYYFRVMKSVDFGKEVRLNHLQDWIYRRADEHGEVYLKATTAHNEEIQKNNVWASAVGGLQEGAVYFILAYKVVFQGLSIGDFSMYMTSVTTFSDNLGAIVAGIADMMQSGLFIRDFRYCIELGENQQGDEGRSTEGVDRRNLQLEFRNVSFRYPNTDRYILKNISLTLKIRESLSVVGVNGAGKTTLVKLICRLYEPTDGEILLNGVNIREFSIGDYRDLIGAVFQDFKQFPFSVGENVSFTEDPDEGLIMNCLDRTGLEKKVSGLINGIRTNISKEFDTTGVEFSGGEGQKLAMARALYKDAPILILDEPTAALDAVAEYELYSKFHGITKEKMAIYISHRLSSCRLCDKIAVLENGRIVQYGNHDELIATEGPYAGMWNMQAQYYVEY